MAFTKAGHIISPKTESAVYLANTLLEQLSCHLPLISSSFLASFPRTDFLPVAEPQPQSVLLLLFTTTLMFYQFGLGHETLQPCPQWGQLEPWFGLWVQVVAVHCQLLKEHSSFPVTYILLDKDASRWKDSEYSHFTVTAAISIPGLKKKPHLTSQKRPCSVSRADVNSSYLLLHDILHCLPPLSPAH